MTVAFASRLRREEPALAVSLGLLGASRLGAAAGYGEVIRLNSFLAARIRELPGAVLRRHDRIAVGAGPGGEFVLLVAPAATGRAGIVPYAASIVERLQQCFEALLEEAGKVLALPVPLSPSVGWAIAYPEPGGERVHPLERAVDAAVRAGRSARPDANHRREAVGHVIATGDLRILLQPIVSLRSGSVMGYEALTRGPRGSELESPAMLFEAAEESGMLDPLDRVCCRLALAAQARFASPEQRVFINLSAKTIAGTARPGAGLPSRGLASLGIAPGRAVVEVTERQTVEDLRELREVLRSFQEEGGAIAVDDVGAGYSNLRAIAELRPRYLKIDRSLVQSLDREPAKRALLETFADFAHRVGASLIAEGIETPEELYTLCEIGVDYGQGFFLGRPSPDAAEADPPAVDLIRRARTLQVQLEAGADLHVGALAVPVPAVSEEMVSAEVEQLFEHSPEVSAVVVTAPDGRPVGLLTREKLYQKVGTQFGRSLFSRHSVRLVMDHLPLIMEASTPAIEVAQATAARDETRLYDQVIVTRQGLLAGVVPLSRLLETMSRLSVERAREANPLTGLPGNLALHAALEARLRRGEPFAVIYADLDNFKAVNDQNGFAAGDRVIRHVAGILRDALADAAATGDLLGHIGGDDFLVITRPEQAQRLCSEIGRRFDATPCPVPGCSLTLAVVAVSPAQVGSIEDLSRLAADAKARAKRHRRRSVRV